MIPQRREVNDGDDDTREREGGGDAGNGKRGGWGLWGCRGGDGEG